MAVQTQLPGTHGQTYHVQDRMHLLLGLFALIFVGVLVMVAGIPGSARSVAVSPIVVTPAPSPQSAPVRASKQTGVAFPNPNRGLGSAEGVSVDEQFRLPLAAAPDIAVKLSHPRSTAHATDPAKPAHAIRGISADRLDRSLVYSSALALTIAAAGLLMLGSRRRLW